MEKKPSSEAEIAQLVKKLPSFYGTPKFTSLFTRTCHWVQPHSAKSSPYPHTQFL